MAKNTHLEHLEDDIFNNGYAGANNAIGFLESLRDMLTTGHGGNDVKVTTKWDGAPAIVCGRLEGRFFVGTKSVFNKTQPKICFDEEFIDLHYPGGLNSILKTCLRELSALPIEGVLQGDLLYTKKPPKVTMCGIACYKFKPNTITYCIEAATELGSKVAASDIGIVFHTAYDGIQGNASFGVDVSSLQGVPKIAVFSAEFTNVSGRANLTTMEKTKFNTNISKAKRELKIGQNFLNLIGGGKKTFEFAALFKQYFNTLIRGGSIPSSSQTLLKGFVSFITTKYDAEIAKKKTEKAQAEWQGRKTQAVDYLNTNKTVIYSALSGYNALRTAKMQIIKRLNKIEGVGTFIEDAEGYRVTAPEGFVAIKDGSALKLVDRLEFSKANFTVAKDWS
tara:strand:+ start:1604 stop:2779 length:1176 start_codon:yes stop_codon:yes gene_type:complete